MQKPHWSAWWRLKASCSGDSVASPASDSTVSTVDAVGLDGEQAAAADRDAVEADRARAADAVLAADVRAGEAEAMPEEVGQEQPRLDLLDDDLAVDGDGDLGHAARSQARSSARSTSVPVRCAEIARRRRGSSRAGRRRAASRPASRATSSVSGAPATASATSASAVGRSVTAPTHDAHLAGDAVDAPERDRHHREPVVARRAARAPRTRRPRLGAGTGQLVSTTSSPGASVVR